MCGKKLNVSLSGREANATDDEGNKLEVDCYSNGELVVAVNKEAIVLTNTIAKGLRDFLNERYLK